VLLLLALAVPWYAAVEARNRGFLWYTLIDNHVLNFVRHRLFSRRGRAAWHAAIPRRDAPGLPAVVAGHAVGGGARAAPAVGGRDRAVVGADRAVADRRDRVLSRCRRSSCRITGCRPFPRWPCSSRRLWDESIDAAPDSLRPRALIVPILVVYGLAALAFGLAAVDQLPIPAGVLDNVDLATRNLAREARCRRARPSRCTCRCCARAP